RLSAPAALYDGQNRGGVKNIRYGQFKPGVVRVVIELDALKDYHVERGNGQVRVEIGSERPPLPPRTSGGAASAGATPPAPAAPLAPPPPVTGDPARVSTPVAGATETVDEYLALHHTEALQSQAPRINVQWDDADIQDVVAGFAAFSGRTIVVSKGITGKVTA